jgi:hypothetical protein
MAKDKQLLRNVVLLTAFGDMTECIEEARLSIDEYYEESHELIDSSGYRCTKSIRVVKGEIYNDRGRLVQSFESQYNEAGILTRNRTVHEDGSVTEQVPQP